MAYTVKQLSELSKVTIRTLHFYEEINLLKPAYHGSNGYRYYEEKQLLLLQQILFFKEMGFSLKDIQKVLNKPNFNQLAALNTHKNSIKKDWERLGHLLETIDKTINHLQGIQKMKAVEMYKGFINKSMKNIAPMYERTQEELERIAKEQEELIKKTLEALVPFLKSQATIDSKEVQDLIRLFYEGTKKMFKMAKRYFITFANGCEKSIPERDPELLKFLSDAMKFFIENEVPSDEEAIFDMIGIKEGEMPSEVSSMVTESIAAVKDWKLEDWKKYTDEIQGILQKMALLLSKNLKASSKEVQKLTKEYYGSIKKLQPSLNKPYLVALAETYPNPEYKALFAPHDSAHPRLAIFVSEAIHFFAEKEL